MRVKLGVGQFAFVLLLQICALTLGAQDVFDVFEPQKYRKHHKLLMEARQDSMLLCFIYYSQDEQMHFEVTDPSKLKGVSEHLKTVLLPWADYSKHELQGRVHQWGNPLFIILHPDDIILGTTSDVHNEEDFLQFYGRTQIQLRRHQTNKAITTQGPNHDNYNAALEDQIKLFIEHGEYHHAEVTLGRWVEHHGELSSESELDFLLFLAGHHLREGRVELLLEKYEAPLSRYIGASQLLGLRVNRIMQQMKTVQVIDPALAKHLFEAQLPEHADSLHRLYSISYYDKVESNEDFLIDELYDYLYYFPKTPWDLQYKLYSRAIELTRLDEDRLILLDMLSYQESQLPNEPQIKTLKADLLDALKRNTQAELLRQEAAALQSE